MYHIRFLSSSRSLEFSSLEVKYDILGYRDEGTWQRHSVEYSQHNIVDPYPQACLQHLADGRSLHGRRVDTHTHTHTHTHAHTLTAIIFDIIERKRLKKELKMSQISIF